MYSMEERFNPHIMRQTCFRRCWFSDAPGIAFDPNQSPCLTVDMTHSRVNAYQCQWGILLPSCYCTFIHIMDLLDAFHRLVYSPKNRRQSVLVTFILLKKGKSSH